MKKTESELTEIFEKQISFIFGKFKKLPNYGQANPTFIAMPRGQNTFEDIKLRFPSFEVDVRAEDFKASGRTHIINLEEDSRIVIIYAKNEEDFDWIYNYHSYTSSIIIGKMLKKIGLKYSEDGLQYLQHDLRENHQSVVGTINITKDFERVLNILELDIDKFKAGFTNLDSLLGFLAETPYLKVSKFINREKEQRTFLLQKFEEYLILNNIENTNYKSLEFSRVVELFPEINFEEEKAKLLEKAEKKKGIHDKLNGRVILDMIPNFDKTQIGEALYRFKNSFESIDEHVDFMIEHSSEEVFCKFKEVNQLT